MFKSLNYQVLLQIILALTSYQTHTMVSTPAPVIHHPEASFRVGVTKGPADTITTTITPTNEPPVSNHVQLKTLPGTLAKPNSSFVAKKALTAKSKTSATPQVLAAPVPISMGAIILMGGNNNIKDRSEEALVVLIPYNPDQLPAVSELTKWLYEQQTVNLRKLEDKIPKQSLKLKLGNVKTVIITRTDLQPYMTSTGASFEHAVNCFAEALGSYEKIMSQLQFKDLKQAALSKMQNTKRSVIEFH